MSSKCRVPLVLRVTVPRYRCTKIDCGRSVFNQGLGKMAAPRSSTTRCCARYVLRRLLIDRTTISAIGAELGVSWHIVNSIATHTTANLVAAAGADRQKLTNSHHRLRWPTRLSTPYPAYRARPE